MPYPAGVTQVESQQMTDQRSFEYFRTLSKGYKNSNLKDMFEEQNVTISPGGKILEEAEMSWSLTVRA